MPGWPGIGEFLPNVEEWIERCNGKLRADAAHDKQFALGFAGSERSLPLLGHSEEVGHVVPL